MSRLFCLPIRRSTSFSWNLWFQRRRNSWSKIVLQLSPCRTMRGWNSSACSSFCRTTRRSLSTTLPPLKFARCQESGFWMLHPRSSVSRSASGYMTPLRRGTRQSSRRRTSESSLTTKSTPPLDRPQRSVVSTHFKSFAPKSSCYFL